MNKARSIPKIILLTISVSMFLFQMKIALKNLADPPIVMTEERFNLKDIDPPLLTICPQDQIDADKLRTLGYTTYRNHLLKGKTEASRNISFWKNFDDALKFSPEDYTIFFLSRNLEQGTVFNIGFGQSKDIW